MIKKSIYITSILCFIQIEINSQILNVPEVTQEQNQWCWAGVTTTILDYYGYPTPQCDIAEYTRTVATWNDFGSTNCCTNPSVGCNYWNYNYGYDGSIQDILVHFGSISNYGYSDPLSLSMINTEIAGNRPFVVRWGWDAGGGHFVVGHGVSGNDVYYMNPWFGEGLHVSTYDWLVSGGTHTWTHTNVLTTAPIGIEDEAYPSTLNIFPNPSSDFIQLTATNEIQSVQIMNVMGEVIYQSSTSTNNSMIDVSSLENGLYLIEIRTDYSKETKKFLKN